MSTYSTIGGDISFRWFSDFETLRRRNSRKRSLLGFNDTCLEKITGNVITSLLTNFLRSQTLKRISSVGKKCNEVIQTSQPC